MCYAYRNPVSTGQIASDNQYTAYFKRLLCITKYLCQTASTITKVITNQVGPFWQCLAVMQQELLLLAMITLVWGNGHIMN